MRTMKGLLLGATLLSGVAHAANDKPIIAPAPDWVKPVALPPKPEKADEAPVRLMLADQQTRLEPGRVSNYADVAMQIQTPQGLSAGNLSVPWNPETDQLTVHKLIIHRDGKDIDVLAGGQTFTVVRREPNLENAMLDGVLTANIQPEGLQVGDVLEYAFTVSSSDPVLRGHVEQMGAGWNGVPFLRTHFRAEWPSSIPVTIRQNGALPALKPVKAGAMTSVELSMDDVQPVIPPRLAPRRFVLGRGIELSDFKSWADAGALMAPLYETAAKVPAEGPLRAELEKIKAAGTDPVKRTEAALALVQDRIRYVALLMGAGGLTPAKAEETWARRFGDCKAKTALLLALLHELGIEAEPVAANIVLGDGIGDRLPMIGLFNHVLVRAHVGGKAYWLDGTRQGDTSLARLRTPDFGWGLPLVAKNAALVRMLPQPLDKPDYDLAIDIDASNALTLPAPLKAQITLRGDEALGMRMGLANLTADLRDNALREYWKDQLSDIEVTSSAARYDAATGEEILTMEGKANMDWKDGQYWTDGTWVGYDADFSRPAGTNSDAPFAVDYPTYNRTVETIRLPPGFTEANIFRKEPIDETVGGVEYRRSASLKDNVFRIERTVRATVPELAAKDAPAAQKRLKALSDLPVAVRKPATYRLTTAELAEEMKTTPTDADGFVKRGWLLLEQGKRDEARAAIESALKLEPDNESAKLAITTFYMQTNDLDAAAKYAGGIDLAKVQQPYLAWSVGGIALMKGDAQRAIVGYTRALELKADQPQVFVARAQAYYSLGKNEAALADAAASLKIDPKQPDVRLLRANIFRNEGKRAEGIAEADALILDNPDDSYAHVVAARAFAAFGEQGRAMKEIDLAIELKPDATAYVNRADLRPKTDVAGRLADLDAAIKADPDMPEAVFNKAALQMEQKDYAGAIKTYSEIIPKWDRYYMAATNARGIAYTKLNDAAHANADFTEARKRADKANDASSLNTLCYEKATAGAALDRALDECNAALVKAPDSAAILDSKAFVLLRLGRIDESIAFFDKALAKNPKLGASLYGRAIAWSKKGDDGKAQTDREAALKINPDMQKRFEAYGVTM